MKSRRILFFLTATLTSFSFVGMEPKRTILACSLEIFSENRDSEKIVGALKSAFSLLTAVGITGSFKLARNTGKIHGWAKEIEKDTIGKGNIVHKLSKKINSELNVQLSDQAIKEMIAVGTDPQPNEPAIERLQKLVKNFTLIAFGNQDRIEHEIYRKKMEKTLNIEELFSAVVTIASYKESPHRFKKRGYCRYKDKPLWYLAKTPYSEQTFKAESKEPFKKAVEHAAEKLECSENQITYIKTEEELLEMSNSHKK